MLSKREILMGLVVGALVLGFVRFSIIRVLISDEFEYKIAIVD